MENYVLPIKTLHGTKPESLLQDYLNAIDAMRTLQQKFNSIEFNARDYVTFDAYCKAREQRIDEYLKLVEVEAYLNTIAESI